MNKENVMDVRHANSITGAGSPAAARVASSLSLKSQTNKTQGVAKPRTAPAAGSGADSGATDTSDITSSDFLTLLVSELQNQDPTQPADPNAYITQLVQVNSLQQLIQMNQTEQLAGGDTVALLNDIDYTVNPSSSVATPSDPGSTSSDSGSGANSNFVERAKQISNVDSAFGMQSGAGQNSIWNGGGSN
jgi:flagellar basal-body rod modification protein FlgD